MALRHRGRVHEVELADSPADSSATSDSSDFDAAFGRLSVDQRALLVLHHLHGYDVREIATEPGRYDLELGDGLGADGDDQLAERAHGLLKSGYGGYLLELLERH